MPLENPYQPDPAQLAAWLRDPGPGEDLAGTLRASRTTPDLLASLRAEVPDLASIPALTYTTYRIFEHSGSRGEYQTPYFLRRAMLTRAAFDLLLASDAGARPSARESARDALHDVLWAICEETTWVLPAHEEQGPPIWNIDPAVARTAPLGAHTMLTRAPDSIDLFCAETGAALAEVLYLLGDQLAPEVVQRVRQEVQRRIFAVYLAHGRDHWWYHGALNWNGVCNGSIGLAFLRLERDIPTLVQALTMVLEGFEAYIATGFEADGGSIEGVGYWNYGLMYFTIVAELLREISRGELDLLAGERMRQVAAYPVGMALDDESHYINYGDAPDQVHLSPGIVARLAERTEVETLRALLTGAVHSREHHSAATFAKFPVIVRWAAWWHAREKEPDFQVADFHLPETGVIKFVAQPEDAPRVVLATKAGHTDGHHAHTDVASFILNVGGESLLPDPGRGLYNKDYFRAGRYANIFNNSYAHQLPRINGKLQAPGPEFGGQQRYGGTLLEVASDEAEKRAVIDFGGAYDVPGLASARRSFTLEQATGTVTLQDEFVFTGEPLPIEEAFVTWAEDVQVAGDTAIIRGARHQVTLRLVDKFVKASFVVESLAEQCRANHITDRTLTRLSVALPPGTTYFVMIMIPAAL